MSQVIEVKKGSIYQVEMEQETKTGLISHYQFDIGSGQFTFMHLKNNCRVVTDCSLSFSTDKYVRICASHNGLLLLSSIKADQLCYHVYDPNAKNCDTLPQPCIATGIIRSAITFDKKHYQVVLLHVATVHDDAEDIHDRPLGMVIFSSETGRWINHQPIGLRLPPSCLQTSEFPELEILPLYSDGSFHWELCGHLLVYKVENDSCELIELPNVSTDWSYSRRCFWESQGHVNYTYTDSDGIHTWELLKEEDHNLFLVDDRNKFRWQLTRSIMHDNLIREHPEIFRSLRGVDDHSIDWEPCHTSPVAYIESTDSMYLQLPGLLVCYNLRNKVLERVCTYNFIDMDYYCCSFFPIAYAEQCISTTATQTTAGSEEIVTLPLQDQVLCPLSV